MAKLDFQTDNRTRGRFARLLVFINLNKPLVSQVTVESVTQRVEYEALPTVCFECGKYDHFKEVCPKVVGVDFHDPPVATVDSSSSGVGGVRAAIRKRLSKDKTRLNLDLGHGCWWSSGPDEVSRGSLLTGK